VKVQGKAKEMVRVKESVKVTVTVECSGREIKETVKVKGKVKEKVTGTIKTTFTGMLH
jgi:hypothetical protein